MRNALGRGIRAVPLIAFALACCSLFAAGAASAQVPDGCDPPPAVQPMDFWRRLISMRSSVGWFIIAARNTTPTLRRCCMRPNNGSRSGRRRWPNRPSFWTSMKRRYPTGAEISATNLPISSRGLARSIGAASAATCNGNATSVRLRSSRRLTYTNPHAVRTWRSHAGLWTCFHHRTARGQRAA